MNSGIKVHQFPTLNDLLCIGRVDEVVIAILPDASILIFELSRCFHKFVAVSLRVLASEGF